MHKIRNSGLSFEQNILEKLEFHQEVLGEKISNFINRSQEKIENFRKKSYKKSQISLNKYKN